MILYGNTKKKPLIKSNIIEVLVNPDKAIINFSEAAMKHFGIAEGYIGISEDEGTVVAGVAERKLYMYITKEGEGFKVFKNGNVNSRFYALLLQDAFNRGGTGIFKLDIATTPTVIKDLEEITFYEFSKSTEGIVAPQTKVETAAFVATLSSDVVEVPVAQEVIDSALNNIPEIMESQVETYSAADAGIVENLF